MALKTDSNYIRISLISNDEIQADYYKNEEHRLLQKNSRYSKDNILNLYEMLHETLYNKMYLLAVEFGINPTEDDYAPLFLNSNNEGLINSYHNYWNLVEEESNYKNSEDANYSILPSVYNITEEEIKASLVTSDFWICSNLSTTIKTIDEAYEIAKQVELFGDTIDA